ncbi:hypothetical protein BDFB_015158 [Asbolus verrucosus]|uniref:Anoctamin n=1 Tax=Asbolus verrucosus TaxID=1661398 RepID=A0A482WBY2_ASBVE|nr:hypothetical protein BDFB_015158 [Asbolus verrucosus]
MPMWGDQSEIFCRGVFDEYFGTWFKISYYIYFGTGPFMVFTAVRLCFVLLYTIFRLQVQFQLINEYILQISNDFDIFDD